jgi:predicted DNA-binding transcriptional regulator AlpA
MPDEVLTIKEVAALLKLAEKTVYANPPHTRERHRAPAPVGRHEHGRR